MNAARYKHEHEKADSRILHSVKCVIIADSLSAWWCWRFRSEFNLMPVPHFPQYSQFILYERNDMLNCQWYSIPSISYRVVTQNWIVKWCLFKKLYCISFRRKHLWNTLYYEYIKSTDISADIRISSDSVLQYFSACTFAVEMKVSHDVEKRGNKSAQLYTCYLASSIRVDHWDLIEILDTHVWQTQKKKIWKFAEKLDVETN